MLNRLYVHVPFCIKKCHYCAFVSSAPEQKDLVDYPSLLMSELQLQKVEIDPLVSIYFGGGTPSLLQPQQISTMLENISEQAGISINAEITLEVNPGTVDKTTLLAFRSAGINRLSMGIQSFDNCFLEGLGRIHTTEQAHMAFRNAREAGFNNISIDLIHSLPDQTLHQWRMELMQAIQLNPEHISIYGLTVEENTAFANTYPAGSPELADEDLSADMFELADELLTASGFAHYEIANYARPGFQSQHNSGYWKRDGYLGLGVAAHTFLRSGYGIRFSNPETLAEYRCSVMAGKLTQIGKQELTQSDAMAEYLFLGLRLAVGVDLQSFEHEFGQSLESAYGSAAIDLMRLGLLVKNGEVLTLTMRGMLLSNQVFAKFL